MERLEVSGAVRPIYGSLDVKRLISDCQPGNASEYIKPNKDWQQTVTGHSENGSIPQSINSNPLPPSRALTAPSGPWLPQCRTFTITLRHTTLGRTPLDEWSAQNKDLYLHNTQHWQETDIHASGRIRTHNSSKRAAAYLRLRPCSQWDGLKP